MSATKSDHPLLQRPLYVFDLPEEILSTLTLKSQGDRTPPVAASPRPATPTQQTDSANASSETELNNDGPSKATSCNLCNLSFPSVTEQRSHVRSDLHAYNLKQKMKGLKPVEETEFEKLVGDLDESISGSESEESDDTEEEGKGKDSTLSVLLKRQAKIADPDFELEGASKRQRGAGKPPLVWFSSPSLAENMSLGVYRAIFSDAEQEEESHMVEAIRRKQLAPRLPPKVGKAEGGGVMLPATEEVGPHFFLCMIGGGHFAAMIIALAPKKGKSHTGADERSATVIAHKTFHRYTTRRKQGGSQSASDATGRVAHSAGSSLRRYNEQALTEEVRNLLKEWKHLIDTADLLFIRATGSTNRRTLFGPYDGQVLRNGDARNRGFPFSTRRATQKELMRAFVELTRVKHSTIDEAALAALNAPAATPTLPKTNEKPKPQKPSKEDEAAALHTQQLTALIKRLKIPALLAYLRSNNLSAEFSFVPAATYYHTPTPLHLAASLNAAPVVLALLTKAGANPTVMNDDARTPFSLAGDRATRDAFRLARSQLGEAAFDWEAAGVPAALSQADFDKREAREKQEKEAEDKAEAERRKKETERLRKETEEEEKRKREQRIGKGRVVGAAPVKTAQEVREEEARGMTPEARMRLERERRARAAEERMRRFAQGN